MARTKGQIQMFETIAVLLIFFFLIAFGLSFYFLVAKTQAAKEHERTLQLRAITLSQKISTIPELDCVKVTVQVERCFDLIKVMNFSTLIKNNASIKDDYFGLFGYSTVELKQVFPEPVSYVLYDKRLETRTLDPETGVYVTTEKYNDVIPSYIPILLRDPIRDEMKFAMLEVKIYAE